MSETLSVSVAQIEEAYRIIRNYFPPTPLQKNYWLSEMLGMEIYLKLETLTPVGSFKIRGATAKVSKLSENEKSMGVIAASAGNHAQGVAFASKVLGVQATIVMPETAPLMKIENTAALGAQIILQGATYDDAFAHAQKLSTETGKIYVHAYEDPWVIAGQGTVGLEIFDQLPEAEAVIVAMGGGGLAAGIGLALKGRNSQAKIIGCQAEGASSLVQSLNSAEVLKSASVSTFADGIAVKAAKKSMVDILKKVIDETYTASDEEIASAVYHLLERGKILTEGAGALPLAIAEKEKSSFYGQKVVIVLGGGNIDLNVLGRIIDRAFVRTGKRIRINALIGDKPGSLAQLATLIGNEGGNIIQAIHDRNEPTTQINQTEILFTLETRGPDHSEIIVAAMEKFCEKVRVIDSAQWSK